jgi:hypothetical protein
MDQYRAGRENLDGWGMAGGEFAVASQSSSLTETLPFSGHYRLPDI